MKEATGSTTMLYVLLIFLAVFITFIAVAFNYARAFKVKNTIIDIIEKNEGIDGTDIDDARTQIESYLTNVKYKVEGVSCDSGYDSLLGSSGDEVYGYCIGKSTSSGDSVRDEVYYSVETFAVLNFPFAGLSLKIPVKGETRVVVNEETISSGISSSASETSEDCPDCWQTECQDYNAMTFCNKEVLACLKQGNDRQYCKNTYYHG